MSGAGFEPGAQISIDLHSDPIHLATTTADGSGTFSVTVRLPAREYCAHTITATAADGTTASVPITIGGCTGQDRGTGGRGNGGDPGNYHTQGNGGHDGNRGDSDQQGGDWSDGGSSDHGDSNGDGGNWSDDGSNDRSDGGGSQVDASMLPDTGAAVGGLGALALALTAGGAVIIRRRRRSHP